MGGLEKKSRDYVSLEVARPRKDGGRHLAEHVTRIVARIQARVPQPPRRTMYYLQYCHNTADSVSALPYWLHSDSLIYLQIQGLRPKGSLLDTSIACLVETYLCRGYCLLLLLI